jgi:hypothetical protein
MLFHVAGGGPVSTKLLSSHLSSISLEAIHQGFLALPLARVPQASGRRRCPPPTAVARHSPPPAVGAPLPAWVSCRNLRSHIPLPLPTPSLKPLPPSSALTRLCHVLHSDQPRHMLRHWPAPVLLDLATMRLLGHCYSTFDNFIPHGGDLPPSWSCYCLCRLCRMDWPAVPEQPGHSFVVEALHMRSWFRSWCVLLMFISAPSLQCLWPLMLPDESVLACTEGSCWS